MQGKVALVTGAGSGIGRATAVAFAREGAQVVVSDIMVQGGEETVHLIQQAGGKAIFVKTDVSKAAEVEAMVVQAVSTYGRLDYACNNAGIGGPLLFTADYSEADWNRVIGINLTGVWLCMKYEIQQMLKNNGGVIVNMASILGLVGFAGSPAYVAAKHGIVGLTKTAAIEYATQNIRVAAVCPAFIQTPMVEQGITDPAAMRQIEAMHPMRRLGKPDEVAEMVIWVCSDRASFVTGCPLLVDGGYVAQ